MSKFLLHCLAAVLLSNTAISQSAQPEPFAFRYDKLGMSFKDFEAQHVEPGEWENGATRITDGIDPHHSPPGDGWKWKPSLVCKELVTSVILECRYTVNIAAGTVTASSASLFVEGRLAVVGVNYPGPSPIVQQALVDKFGRPARIPVLGNSNQGLSALRWDNGVSVVELQEHYCGSDIWTTGLNRQFWEKDVSEVLGAIYCRNDEAANFGYSFIWYVHKALFSRAVTRWNDVIREIRNKAGSEPFAFSDNLGMSLADFKEAHSGTSEASCRATASGITECAYSADVLGVKAFAGAIFADNRLGLIHFYYVHNTGQFASVSGVTVSVDIPQALINRFGAPQVVQGYGNNAFSGDDLRALRWDGGTFVVEYQGNNCGHGDDYERATKVLLGRYCDKTDLGDGTVSIWNVDKELFGVAMSRHKKALEDARKKARSDM